MLTDHSPVLKSRDNSKDLLQRPHPHLEKPEAFVYSLPLPGCGLRELDLTGYFASKLDVKRTGCTCDLRSLVNYSPKPLLLFMGMPWLACCIVPPLRLS